MIRRWCGVQDRVTVRLASALCVSKLSHMQNLSIVHGPNIVLGKGYNRDGFPFTRDKLDFERRPLLIAMDNRSNISCPQPIFLQVTD
jgi:hypothetical protein